MFPLLNHHPLPDHPAKKQQVRWFGVELEAPLPWVVPGGGSGNWSQVVISRPQSRLLAGLQFAEGPRSQQWDSWVLAEGVQCWPGSVQAPCGFPRFMEQEPVRAKPQRVLSKASRMKS